MSRRREKKNKRTRLYLRSQRWLPTNTNWHPSFAKAEDSCVEAHREEDDFDPGMGGFVIGQVTLIEDNEGKGSFRVIASFSGLDDHALGVETYYHNEDQGRGSYERWCAWLGRLGLVDGWQLQDLGFIPW